MSLPNAFVTLLTTPSYLPGALVLLHALFNLHPAPRDFKIVCLVTPETVDARTIGELRKAGFDLVIGVEPIGSGASGRVGLDLMGRPDLNFALTKLHLFRLEPLFSTLIYLDADVLPIRPLDHLFSSTNPHVLSACPDTGWPDCFNSGVMVIRPRESDWVGLRTLLRNGEGGEGLFESAGNGSFDGADQGLLNEWFSEEGGGGAWNRLLFLYNVTPTAAYQYEPAYRRYGHKINAVHFIGPNKPWSNLANRPAGMSSLQGKDAKYDYPSLIDRWYAIYDRHIRPTAAHHPDLAQRFLVPESIAAWNQPGVASGVPAQPHDRLDLSELKDAAKRGVSALKSGQYLSLPLDGRLDLMMPKPKSKASFLSTQYASPSAIASPLMTAPPPQTIQQQMTEPATWDAARHPPPQHSGPEMSIPINMHYAPAWDQPPSAQSAYYSSQHTEPEYPNIPANVRSDEWYKHFTTSTPDRSNIQPLFPWEKGPRQRRPDRIFPEGDSPLRQHGSHPDASASTHHASSSLSSPSGQTPPKSMQEAIASYTNAWDTVPSIQRYMSSISGPGVQTSKRDSDLKGLQSIPGTPGFEVPHRRGMSTDRRSDVSGDGDDEDDEDEEDAMETNSTPSVGHSRESTFDLPLEIPMNARYRARQGPADRSYQEPSFPGGPSGPLDRTPPEKKPLTRRIPSLSETRKPASNFQSTRLDISAQTYHTPTPSNPEAEPKTSRIWDPRTDVDVRKRDSQSVLTRFMNVSGAEIVEQGK